MSTHTHTRKVIELSRKTLIPYIVHVLLKDHSDYTMGLGVRVTNYVQYRTVYMIPVGNGYNYPL